VADERLAGRFRRWLWRPPRPHGEPIYERTVSSLELFYDLVYVAVVSEAAHHLADHVSLRGVVEFAIVFVLVWIGWTNGTLYLELHGRGDGRTRTVVFVQMGVLVILAVFTAEAAGEGGRGFAFSYAAFHVPGESPVFAVDVGGGAVVDEVWGTSGGSAGVRRRARRVDCRRTTPGDGAAATVPVTVAVHTTRRRDLTGARMPTVDRSVGEEGGDLTGEVVEVLEEKRVSRVAVQHELGVGQLSHCGVGRIGVDHDVV
jgi:hypothetical protein